MKNTFSKGLSVSVLVAGLLVAGSAQADCSGTLSSFTSAELKSALDQVVTLNNSGGFNLPMWLTLVDETGIVCAVVTSGRSGGGGSGINDALVARDKWLASRVISAQKANTANSLSFGDGTNGVSISSGALYAAVQPGASLYGLSDSNPVDTVVAYHGDSLDFGTGTGDPMTDTSGQLSARIGGINTFGGGLAIYGTGGKKKGAIGVSGDTSCTDHAVAWQVRELIGAAAGSPGGFEKLTLTSGPFAALGDHPSCGDDDVQAGNASLGFN